MSRKNKNSKRFVIIMAVIVILVIVVGTWLTWEIVKDGMDSSSSIDYLSLTKEQLLIID